MQFMQRSAVISIDEARVRARRVGRAIDMRRALTAATTDRRERRRSRAWLNGVELGDAARFAYLTESYD